MDGQRVKCRVVYRPSAPKSKSTEKSTGAGDEGEGDGNRESFEPVELSLRESRLDPARDAEEAARREDAPEVGSTVKVKILSIVYVAA